MLGRDQVGVVIIEENEMAQKTAPSAGVYTMQVGREVGRFRVRKGDRLPDGAKFEAAERDSPRRFETPEDPIPILAGDEEPTGTETFKSAENETSQSTDTKTVESADAETIEPADSGVAPHTVRPARGSRVSGD